MAVDQAAAGAERVRLEAARSPQDPYASGAQGLDLRRKRGAAGQRRAAERQDHGGYAQAGGLGEHDQGGVADALAYLRMVSKVARGDEDGVGTEGP